VTASAIVGTPNLLFLGAGASKPYGKLLMGEFIRSFREKMAAPSKGTHAIPTKTLPLLDAICTKNEDLEFLIGELEALTSLRYLGRHSIPSSAPMPIGGGGSGRGIVSHIAWPDFQQLASQAADLLSRLKREVYFEYRDIPDLPETSILVEPIKALKTSSHPMVVFTTNYDPAVEEFCAVQEINLIDGFARVHAREDVWNRDNFERVVTPQPNAMAGLEGSSLVLFKLHGSVEWHKIHGRIVKSHPIYDPPTPTIRT